MKLEKSAKNLLKNFLSNSSILLDSVGCEIMNMNGDFGEFGRDSSAVNLYYQMLLIDFENFPSEEFSSVEKFLFYLKGLLLSLVVVK